MLKRKVQLDCADVDAREAKKLLLNNQLYVAMSRIESALRVLKEDNSIEVKPDFDEIADSIQEYWKVRNKDKGE